MIVCSCNVLSDHAIREACTRNSNAPRTPGQVHKCFGCSPQCGRCTRTIRSILEKAQGCATDCAACPAVHAHERALAALEGMLPDAPAEKSAAIPCDAVVYAEQEPV